MKIGKVQLFFEESRADQDDSVNTTLKVKKFSLRSHARPAWLITILALICTATIVVMCLPNYYSEDRLKSEYSKPDPTLIPQDYKDLVAKAKGDGVPLGRAFVFDINWLVGATYLLYGTQTPTGILFRPEIKAYLRPERIFVAIVATIILIGSAIFVFANIAKDEGGSQQWNHKLPSITAPTEDALLVEINNAWFAARRFYNWSLYLLGSGVAMAFIGMAVFILTIPSREALLQDLQSPQVDWKIYLILTIRPIGILIFMEAVAWFLLRQYRSATEDFKTFHKIYLRRSNYFSASKALAELESREKAVLLANALLAEDLSGRLNDGQSTEAIESMKIDEVNPVFDVLSKLTARFADHELPEARGKKVEVNE
ncbi:hypothetical protein G3N57_04090 [Paraburkholderia sp. Se-20369]|nr:hypothetical protein [Paraburkholderia sp. Se-20369]